MINIYNLHVYDWITIQSIYVNLSNGNYVVNIKIVNIYLFPKCTKLPLSWLHSKLKRKRNRTYFRHTHGVWLYNYTRENLLTNRNNNIYIYILYTQVGDIWESSGGPFKLSEKEHLCFVHIWRLCLRQRHCQINIDAQNRNRKSIRQVWTNLKSTNFFAFLHSQCTHE